MKDTEPLVPIEILLHAVVEMSHRDIRGSQYTLIPGICLSAHEIISAKYNIFQFCQSLHNVESEY
jgi:hypothetical protein